MVSGHCAEVSSKLAQLNISYGAFKCWQKCWQKNATETVHSRFANGYIKKELELPNGAT